MSSRRRIGSFVAAFDPPGRTKFSTHPRIVDAISEEELSNAEIKIQKMWRDYDDRPSEQRLFARITPESTSLLSSKLSVTREVKSAKTSYELAGERDLDRSKLPEKLNIVSDAIIWQTKLEKKEQANHLGRP